LLDAAIASARTTVVTTHGDHVDWPFSTLIA
jgi:hypothetical protein